MENVISQNRSIDCCVVCTMVYDSHVYKHNIIVEYALYDFEWGIVVRIHRCMVFLWRRLFAPNIII